MAILRPPAIAALALLSFAPLLLRAGVEAQEVDEASPADVPPSEDLPVSEQGRAAEEAQLERLFFEALEGQPGGEQELEAWALVRAENLIRARGLAEQILSNDPRSYIAHLVLAHVHHYAEANFARSVYHAREARRFFEARHGEQPGPSGPWRWHARILREVAESEKSVDGYRAALAAIERYNRLYSPRMLAERAWPLMKLRRFEAARLAAMEGIATGEPRQAEVALNALCAVEWEAGVEGRSYEACEEAVELARARQGQADVVDLSNFAEAARARFRLDQAESLLLEAASRPEASYANPYRDLADLYLRQGRFLEALDALERMPAFIAARPPHMRRSDRGENLRVIAAFLVAVGESERALPFLEQAMVLGARSHFSSRDPAQDRAVLALLERSAHLSRAERLLEQSAALPFYRRWWARMRSWVERLAAYRSGRKALRALANAEILIGTFQLGLAQSAIMPPWLVGDAIEVVGAGVVDEAVERARKEDPRADASPYYGAIEAEAAFEKGDRRVALELSRAASASLERSEALLAARARALALEIHLSDGREADAVEAALDVLARDPGVLRRRGIALPIELSVSGGELAERLAEGVARSPRFDPRGSGLRMAVEGEGRALRACLYGPHRERLGCAEAEAEGGEESSEVAQRALDALHEAIFAPRLDLSQSRINSLDGSNEVGRDALETLFDRWREPSSP